MSNPASNNSGRYNSALARHFSWLYHIIMAGCEKMPSERSLVATAYHEAGHAVMALLLNMPLDYVTIRRCDLDSDCLGHTVLKSADVYRRRVLETVMGVSKDPLPDYEARMYIENHCIMLLAGVIAEYQRFPHSNSIWASAKRELADSDMNRLMGWLSRLHGTEEDASKNGKALLFWAKRELCKDRTWAKVAAVAELLLKEGRLSCEQIREAGALRATVQPRRLPTPCLIDVETGVSFAKQEASQQEPPLVNIVVAALIVVVGGIVLRGVALSGAVMGTLFAVGCIAFVAFSCCLDAAASTARRRGNAADVGHNVISTKALNAMDCPYCDTQGMFLMSDGRCPNCKTLLSKA